MTVASQEARLVDGGVAGERRSPRPDRMLGRIAEVASPILTGVLWVLLGTLVLLSVGPRFLPFKTYTVLSGSMEPAIPVGALVVLTPVEPEDLGVGDVITFDPPGFGDRLVTHRIIGVTAVEGGFDVQTQGDANAAPDLWTVAVRETGYRMAVAIPFLGWVTGALWGKVIATSAVVLILGAWLLIRIWRSDEDEDGDAPARPELEAEAIA